MSHDLVITGGRVLYPEKTLRADVAVSQGKITAVQPPGSLKGKQTIDAQGCFVLPGLIDPHTHPVYMDTFADPSRTGAFGGVTTVVPYAYAGPGDGSM